jgi:PAS domain S-box-containing protein
LIPPCNKTPLHLGAVFGLLLVTAFIVTTFVVADRAGKMAKEEAVARLRDAGHYHATKFVEHLTEPLFTARSLAISLSAAAESGKEIRRSEHDPVFLRTLRRQEEYFGVWAIFGPDRFGADAPEAPGHGYVPYAYRKKGELVFEHDNYAVDRELDYYLIPTQRKRESIIEPYIDPEADHVLMSSLAVPVFSKGEVIGVAGVDVELASLSERIAKVRPYGEGHAILVSSEGTIVAHPKGSLAGQKMTVAGFDESHLEEVARGAEFDEIRTDRATGESVSYTFTPVAIGDTGTFWTMVQVVPTTLIMQRAESITQWTTAIAVLSIAVLFTVLILFVRSVVRPLHESHQTVRVLLDSMADGVVMHDARGVIRSFNKRFPELLGIGPDAIKEVGMPALLHRFGSTPLYEQLPEDTGDVGTVSQGTLTNEAGITFPVEISARRIRVSNESCFLTAIRDISARMRLEEQRREALLRIRRQEKAVLQLALHRHDGDDLQEFFAQTAELAARTLEVSRVGIWTGTEATGKITCMNLYDATTGQHSSGSEIRATDYPDYFEAISIGLCVDAHDARVDPRTRGFLDTLLEPLGINSLLDSAIRVSGMVEGVICFEHTGPPRVWTEDEVSFASQIADQLAKAIVHAKARQEEEHRQKLEARFQQMQKLESLGIMAGGIAHDFNNLLLTIIGNLEMSLAEIPGDTPARQSLEESRKASLLAADLCGQMLAYSGKGHFIIHPISLANIVKEMVALLESSITKRADLRLSCPDELPLILGDSAQLRQILLNLILNAADAVTGGQGLIDIRIGTRECDASFFEETMLKDPLAPGAYVELEVKDNGCGMDEPTLQRIFDPFFTTKFTGRGLGLAAVLGIVRGHRGAIMIDSEIGKGTSFRILLPVATEAAMEQASASRRVVVDAPGTPSPKEKITVLLVDDDDGVRTTISRQLMRLGFQVISVADGFEALALVERSLTVRDAESHAPIDLVLLDLTMPRMDGAETFEKLHALAPDLPVVLCSGYSDEELRTRFEGKAIAGYLCKPFEIQTLKAAVREALLPSHRAPAKGEELCGLAG